MTLGLFNIFLRAVDLGSLTLMPFTYGERSWAFRAAFVAAISYFAVYSVDLAQLFPQSPTPMLQQLALIEVLGMTVAVLLIFYSRTRREKQLQTDTVSQAKIWRFFAPAALGVAEIIIVIFSTDAAMNSG